MGRYPTAYSRASVAADCRTHLLRRRAPPSRPTFSSSCRQQDISQKAKPSEMRSSKQTSTPGQASSPPVRIITLRRSFLLLFSAVFTAAIYRSSRDFISASLSGIIVASTYNDGSGVSGVVVPAAFLVAIEEGGTGEDALGEWSNYLQQFNGTSTPPPPIWVLCSNGAIEASVRATPLLRPLVVDANKSWMDTFLDFLWLNEGPVPSVVGLFGEGSLPTLDVNLVGLVRSVVPVISSSEFPTAVVTRSRTSANVFGDAVGTWFSDKLISQVWCNHDFLARERLSKLGLEQQAVQDLTLLEVLPRLLQDDVLEEGSDGVVLIDGTDVIRSTFAGTFSGYDAVPSEITEKKTSLALQQEAAAVAAQFGSTVPADVGRDAKTDLRIGTLKFALVSDDEGDDDTGGSPKALRIVKAPWPPEYVLKTTATEDDLVLVSSVNAGYLDMAVNFLLSVQRAADVQVREGWEYRIMLRRPQFVQ